MTRPQHTGVHQPGGPAAPPAPVDTLLAASVARRFHLENRSRVQIAREFGISRFKVARLLAAAVAHGIVRIDITVPAEIDAGLGRSLTERFALRHAVVVQLPRSGNGPACPADRQHIGHWLGTAAAQLIAAIAREGDVLGLDGSPAAVALSEAVTRLPPCEVVQLTGVHGPDLTHAPVTAAVRRVAAAGAGTAFPLHAPFILPDATTATVWRGRPGTAEAVSRFERVTKAVVGVSAWDAGSSAMYGALSDPERDTCRVSGACADLAGRILDADGQVISTGLDDRMICAAAAQLRGIPELIGVSDGARSTEAVRAALRSGLLTSLVTDATTARRLLWHDDTADGDPPAGSTSLPAGRGQGCRSRTPQAP
ncbi:transcriptional regulator [Streptomyces sp. CHD11]|uniref:sugar-binding transcriptional regulator n=1 Tax=Streptomyces sp. CHD11 TaxID=2741325 RepID=UPI001BFCA57E|nr:sugar-binding domain-containing protein [Streptomyces sp. CHD11]MBT3153579.1 transcriptional regulator [Streptomyces sp. CHD11]